jgi:hypothetical protein
MKPTSSLRNKFSVFAMTPSTSSRFPASLVAIETRSLPTLTHVLPPVSAFGSPIYVARVPAAPFTRVYPRRFTFYVASPAAPFAKLTHSRRTVFQR